MPHSGQKTVTVSKTTFEKLNKIYTTERTKQPKLSFASFISESALIELERRKILREAQLVSLIGFGPLILIYVWSSFFSTQLQTVNH